MDDREEKIRRLKEARSKYADLTRLKLNKTTSSKEFNLGQVRKVEDNFKALQENYSKILENKNECTTPISYRNSLKPKQSIVGSKITSSSSKGKVENIENVTVTDGGKIRAMELLQTIAKTNDSSSSVKNFSIKCLNSNFTEKSELNNENKEAKILIKHNLISEQELAVGEVTTSVKKSKLSKKVCFADDFVPLTCSSNKTIPNVFDCETPISSRFLGQPRQSIFNIKQSRESIFNVKQPRESIFNVKQPRESIFSIKQPRNTNVSLITKSIDSVPVTEEGKKKAMEHLYRLIGTSSSRNQGNLQCNH